MKCPANRHKGIGRACSVPPCFALPVKPENRQAFAGRPKKRQGESDMRPHVRAWVAAAAVGSLATQAGAQNAPQDLHIGIVASLTGPFNGPSKDTIEGFDAWVKSRGVPGKKVVLDTLDDETNPVSA